MPDIQTQKPRGNGAAVVLLLAVLCAVVLAARRGETPLPSPGGLSASPVNASPPVSAPVPAPAQAEAPGDLALTRDRPRSPDQQATAIRTVAQAREGLDTDLIYEVLVAELAGRRGDLASAFSHFLRAAQLGRDPKLADLAVRAALSAGDDAGAGRAVALWLELAPDAPDAHQVAAALKIKTGDRRAALTHLSRLLELAPGDAEAGYLRVAGIVGRTAGPEERVALLRDLVALDETNPEAQQALAIVAASADQHEVAIAAARRAQVLRPDWDMPRQFLIKLLLAEGKRGEARSLSEQYLAAHPGDQGLRMLYGQLLVDEEDYAGARTVFSRLLAERPKDPDVLFAAGILSLELDELDAARGFLTRLYQTGERRDEASFYLGQLEERAGQSETAIDWYAKAQGTNLLEAQIRTAVLRAKAGSVERAREILQQLRDLAPEQAPMLYLAEAEILDQAGRQEAAMQVYEEALAAFPDDLDLLYGRAMYAIKLERIEPAVADLRRIIERNPDHADALNALGYTLADRTDRYQEALGYIERAYRLKPEEPAILDSAGWVNYKLGRPEAALQYLRKAQAALSDGEIAAHLGEVLWSMGRQTEARSVWAAALKEHPQHAYLLKVVGRHPATGAAGLQPEIGQPTGGVGSDR
jgi:tetratricopeptide (TPR) repeat protein